jgi:hypothetical protein
METAAPSVFETAYYQALQKNIIRLHHLMQGTFTAYAENQDAWTVSEGDSVVLCNVPLGDPNKDGYWIYSYEFMTSLPDAPIYTSIKRLEQLSRDTIDVYYYHPKQPVDIQLDDVLNASKLNAKINLEQLVKRDKRVRYVRHSAANFIGKSLLYEDPDRHCLRQNSYDLSPKYYQVETTFYDKQDRRPLTIKKRPNLLVRRNIDFSLLKKLANES